MDVKKTIWGAFGYVYEYRTPLAKALLIPASALVVLHVIPTQKADAVLKFVLSIADIFIYAVLAITTHRIILLGPGSVPEWGIFTPKKRELDFVLRCIGISLFILPFGFLTLIPIIGWAVSLVAVLYVVARFSLVFPAVATDHELSFAESWRATRRHQLHMIIVIAIFPAVISVPERLLDHLPYTGLLVSLLSAITMVIAIAALSIAFQVITTSDAKS